MRYVDGYVIVIAKRKLPAYRRLAQKASKIWREHGALEYREAAGEDLDVAHGVPFPRMVKCKPGETVVFSWIVFKSRAQRDSVNAKVMKDPRLLKMVVEMTKNPIFDMKRFTYGGFNIIVDAK